MCAYLLRHLSLGANDFDGDTAERYGYINRALPDAKLDSSVDALARWIASFDRRQHRGGEEFKCRIGRSRTSRDGPVRMSTVRESYWSFAQKEENILWDVLPGGNMSVATEILSLRQNQSSSVETLLAAIEWEKAAQEEEHILSRRYAVREAADIVLLNVAVHAAEALSEPLVIRRTRRGLLSFMRKSRRSNPGELLSAAPHNGSVGCPPRSSKARISGS